MYELHPYMVDYGPAALIHPTYLLNCGNDSDTYQGGRMKQLIVLGLVHAFISSAFAIQCDGKLILGRVEPVNLTKKNIILEAKLDTGADVSSLSAANIKIFTKENKQWVAFTLSNSQQQ